MKKAGIKFHQIGESEEIDSGKDIRNDLSQ
jgi:hypothetical protein